VVAQAGSGETRLREEEPAGSVKRLACELGRGGAGRALKGQLAARENAGNGRQVVLQRKSEGEAGGRRRGPVHKFCKSSRSSQ
jgi:hypothetical protein